MNLLHGLFTLPGQNVSLPDITHLYSVYDFKTLKLDTKEKFFWQSRTNPREVGPLPTFINIRVGKFLNQFKIFHYY